MIPESLKLQEYRLDRGMTQQEVVNEIYARAVARGDKPPGLCPVAMSRHEHGVKHPCPYYVAMYCEVLRATPEQLGLALPGESGHHDDVDRRQFLTGAAALLATAVLPAAPTTRLSQADIARLRESVVRLYELDHHYGGAGAVYPLTVQTLNTLRSLVKHASYDEATGRALRELVGLTVAKAGGFSFDAGRHEDAQRWWLEALKWGHLAESDAVSVFALASMTSQASEQDRAREAIDFAQAAQRTAGSSPASRLKSVLFAREAVGHAGQGDATSARAALGRARKLAERPRHDDDPIWLGCYGPANFANYECRVALALGKDAAAEDAARTALAMIDPVAYPRARALYLVQLADVLVQRSEIEESTALAQQATVAAAGLDSGRVTRQLQAVTQRLAA